MHRVDVAKAFSAPIALLCLAQIPGYPLDLEGAWGLVLGALCPLRWGIWWLYKAWQRRRCHVMFPCPGNGSWKNFVNLPGH